MKPAEVGLSGIVINNYTLLPALVDLSGVPAVIISCRRMGCDVPVDPDYGITGTDLKAGGFEFEAGYLDNVFTWFRCCSGPGRKTRGS